MFRGERRVPLTEEEEQRRRRRPWKDTELAYDVMLEHVTETALDDLARRQVCRREKCVCFSFCIEV